MTTKSMTKDEAVDIAHTAGGQTLDELIKNYDAFHKMVEVTPQSHYIAESQEPQYEVNHNVVRGLHGAIGLATESAEILDAYKKFMFGKRRPIRPDNIKEECGDVFFYLHLVMDAYGITLRDVIADNVVKLANRYIEKFEV